MNPPLLQTYTPFPTSLVLPRRVDVWCPPAYLLDGSATFPVLYMHDGQNLFEPAHAFGGETWGVAETLSALAAQGACRPALIVGIWNIQEDPFMAISWRVYHFRF